MPAYGIRTGAWNWTHLGLAILPGPEAVPVMQVRMKNEGFWKLDPSGPKDAV